MSALQDDLTMCIDAGQTGIRAQLRGGDQAGPVLEFPGIRNDLAPLPQLADVVKATIANTGQRPVVVALGSSGLESAEPDGLLTLVESVGVRRTLLAHDSITSYLGALGARRGAVIASGTGVVTLAVGVDRVARVDGWGYLLGDAGSGFWIGRAALDRVMRSYDGRGPQTALTAIVARDFADLSEAYREVQADPRKVSRIASYAKVVAQLAETDEVCHDITMAAANELAHSVASGLARVDEIQQPQTAVCAVGNVFKSSLLARAFAQTLTRRAPQARILPPAGNALDGAYALTTLPKDSALSAEVLRASV